MATVSLRAGRGRRSGGEGATGDDRGRSPRVVGARRAAVVAFLSVAAVRHGFFDLKVYYGAINCWVARRRRDLRLPRPGSHIRLHLPAVRRAGHAADGAGCSWPVAIAVSVRSTAWSPRRCSSGGWSSRSPAGPAGPLVRRRLARCLAAAFEPVRETFSFGQVNMLLLFLVAGRPAGLLPGRRRWAGSASGWPQRSS